MKVLRKIVGKTKIDTIRNQQIREFCGIQPINEWMERRRDWDEYVTRMERLLKITRDNITAGTQIYWNSEKKIERLNPWLKQAEPPITRRRYMLCRN
jgi:hypothetical protein